MELTTSISLCSSSPASFSSSRHNSATCSVMEMDFGTRIPKAHNAGSRPAMAGCTALFANSNARQIVSSSLEQPESASASNLFVRNLSLESTTIDSFSFTPPNSNTKMRDYSPVSVLHGPLSYCRGQGFTKFSNNFCLLDQHIGSAMRSCSLTVDPQQPYFWQGDFRDSWETPEEHLGSFTLPQAFARGFSDLALIRIEQMSEQMLRDAQACFDIFSDPLVVEAFHEAKKGHRMQYRVSGDLYLQHCVETAKNLARICEDKEIIAAGLLHDVIDDSAIDYNEIQEMFGKRVADLVEGVSKMSEFSKLARENDIAGKSVEADRLHTMFLAMTDVWVVVIKLADRLHNMRTLEALPEQKQSRIAKETLHIFVPLANRLGIWSWKAELEDLCFKHLKPYEYQKLAEKLSGNFRRSTIVAAIEKLGCFLLEEGILYHELTGRRKNLYGIHTKMMRKCKDLEEVHDLQGLRLIVSSKEDCYAALDIVHRLWPPLSSEIKDYIKQPKPNGYQSLHTIVRCEDGFPLEFQIRTKDMHHHAEFGVAAHWRYKEDNVEHSPFIVQIVSWARWMFTWLDEVAETRSRLPFSKHSLEAACSFPNHREGCPHRQLLQTLSWKEDDPLFVIVLEDDKMAVQELPWGSTIADLLQRRLTEDSLAATGGIAFCEELRLRINHRVIDDIKQVLKMGDLVEMMSLIPKDSLAEYRNRIKRIFEDKMTEDSKHIVQVSS